MQNLISQYGILALVAFLITFVMVKAAVQFFPQWGLMDRPHLYGKVRKAIPYYGGLAIFASFLIVVGIFLPFEDVKYLLLASGMVVLVGFLDDKYNVSPWLRLLVQFLAGLVLVFAGVFIFSVNLPILGVVDFVGFSHVTGWYLLGAPLLSALFTIFWVMTILNSMNFVDGVSGLSSGVTFIAGMTIFALSVHPSIHEDPSSQFLVASLSLILAMIALAFFIFDFPKPKILMGDSGSTFFGLMIAVLAILSGGKIATAFLVLGLPILDLLWVVGRRLMAGRKPWQGDLKHLHHRLLDVGFSEKKVVTLYLLVTGFLGFSAITFVSTEQKFFMIVGLGFFMLILAMALVLIPRKK